MTGLDMTGLDRVGTRGFVLSKEPEDYLKLIG